MEEYKHPNLEKYRAVFSELSVKVNDNHSKVKPELSDGQIKTILSNLR
jgi:hypothetical protein